MALVAASALWAYFSLVGVVSMAVTISGSKLRSQSNWHLFTTEQGVTIPVRFDSKTEWRYFSEVLLPRLLAGELNHVTIKPLPIEIEGGTYRADYFVEDPGNGDYFIEVKGKVETPGWRRTRRQLIARLKSGLLTIPVQVVHWDGVIWHKEFLE